jgi:hypothetical protein
MESSDLSITYRYDDKILENEIKSWTSFGEILRNENRINYHQMLEDTKVSSASAKAKGEVFSFESMCMALIIRQQKMINELLNKHSTNKYYQKYSDF